MCKIKYLILLLALPLTMQAQFVNYGSDPARFKWNIVKLPHYNLVYPQGLDSLAYTYALYLENVYPRVLLTMGEPMKMKFPVVLHPGNMQSNGLVSWAPRRMELLTTPASKQNAVSWEKHLVTHESRHVLQTGKLMNGFFRPLYYLIGEQSAGVASFFMTQWFFEGDAVGMETALTNGGRGRLPEFNMPYRARMFDGKDFYSFDKWYLGSYKDYTGDYYAFGYDLTSYARYAYGADIWDRITHRYTHRFLSIPPFGNAIKSQTGHSIDHLYRNAFAFLKKEWEEMDAQDTDALQPSYLSPEAKRYASYQYPQALDGGSAVIAVKSDLKDINSLVKIENGKEKRLAYLGTINSSIVLNHNRVYWTEIVPGLRWTHENYSVVKQYDLQTGRIRTLTPGQRFLSPAVSPDGSRIAVSRVSLWGKNQVAVLDPATGDQTDNFSVPENAFVKELAFGGDNHTVLAVAVGDGGIRILRLDLRSGEWTEAMPATSANITSPVWGNGKLLFESGLNGTNNLYALDLAGRQASRLTSARFGSFQPALSPDGRTLYFSDYQATGYRLASLPVDSLLTAKADFNDPYRFAFAETLAAQEQYNLDTARLEPVDFRPERYRKGWHTFKLHSWAPFYYDVNDAMSTGGDDLSTIVKPGVMVLSQNTLNTAIGQAGWYYKDGYHHGKLSFTYMGWFPILNVEADYGNKAFSMTWGENDEGKTVGTTRRTDRTRLEADVQLYVPFNLTKNHYVRGIQPSVTWYFTNNQYQQIKSGDMRNFQYLLPELLIYNYRRLARRDILPRWGYQLRLQYLNTPFNTENYGSLYAARLTTYWPGLVRNHGLMLRFGYQYQYLDNKALYIPKRLLDKTRGYDYLYQTHQNVAFKADYAFSLFSPDLSLGQLMYIRRVRTNLFYDLTKNQAREDGPWTTQSSCGADLIFDWNVIRMSFPLTTGVRLIQPIDYGNFQAEMLFSITF